MSHYKQLIINEREIILAGLSQGKTIRSISKEMGRAASTISRELKRNKQDVEYYSPSQAQTRYHQQRQHCGRRRKLADKELWKLVMSLFWKELWSPEQIANRIKYEQKQCRISTVTIYRTIYAGLMDSDGRKAVESLRHHEIRRIRKAKKEKAKASGGIKSIWERPQAANGRTVIGHWEGDTVEGQKGSDCLATLVDRHSRFLRAGRTIGKSSGNMKRVIISLLSVLPKKHRKSMTVDCGKEFAQHDKITSGLEKMPVYFCDPHSPWQRGTNENTNGLLREYIPKGEDIAQWTDEEIGFIVGKINTRPRKCLNWKTPYEVFYGSVLHLI